ncbi:MAG TPA: HEAT repeat domain-containing protein, partial [Longimicrobium sp.]|nr:HEAT repeat domain-containing protein [Longimicrobium sp.]
LTARDGETREESGVTRAAVAALLVGAVAVVAPAVASTDGTAQERASTETDVPPLSAEKGRQEIEVIAHPDPAQPLSRRWAWAVDEIARRGMPRAWIAWTVPTGLNPGPTFIASAGLPRSTVNRRLGAPADDAVMLFTVARDGQLEHAVGHSSEVDLARYPVVWLGTARGDESFAELRRLADGLRDPDQRQHLVEAAGIHVVAGVVPYLAAVLGRDGSNGVRREAAFALGRHRSPEALSALRTAVERDGSDDVRREAVDAIGRMGTAESSANLRELAFDGRDADVREGAVEALGQNQIPAGVETLAELALAGRELAIAREAVEAMGRYPAEEAAPTLVRVVWTSDDRGVAREAAESLGRLPASWAVAPLDSIARRHPNSVVAQQAVESLGRYSSDVVEGYLLRIARTHRDPGVREEAMDQLARHRVDPGAGDDLLSDGDLETDTGFGPESGRSSNTSNTGSSRAPSSETGGTRRP